MIVEARQAGVSLRALPPETVNDFLERSGYRPRRSWPS
jgi:L-fuculose-phosphate aldolase